VIEFGDCSDRLPSCGGVAILARQVQIAVRTARHRAALVRRGSGRACRHEHDGQDEIYHDGRNHVALSSQDSTQTNDAFYYSCEIKKYYDQE
jgi:hypothetical protein